ncbi:hypothetical protein HMPREF9551_01379 [Escherichia coli MS 196-1]|nr:hypothetical protein HMPREF9551_01379 [Escherichia coli MS 196-1]
MPPMAVISCHLAQVYAKCRSFMSKPFTIITFFQTGTRTTQRIN